MKNLWNTIGKCIALCAVVLLFVPSVQVCAQTLIDGGTYKGFGYSYDEDTGNVVLESYKGKNKKVVTPKKIKGRKVTEIESSVFSGNKRIEKLVISEGVEKIENMAFYDMQSLKSVSFPMTLRSLGKQSGLNYYSEVSKFPAKTYTVVKGSPAFKFITKKYSGSKIIVKKTNKVVTWFDTCASVSDPAAKVVKKGAKYGKLPTVQRKGYRFLGWYTKKTGGKQITAKKKAKKNQTLYAHWKYQSPIYMLQEPYWDKKEEATVWSTVKFGTYPNKYSSDDTPISWLVLSLNGNEALLMAENGLDAKEYNERYSHPNEIGNWVYEMPKECTWETSTLRSWLNGYAASYNVGGIDYSYNTSFYNTAFSDAEKTMILDTQVVNSGITGNSTTDKVYILSKSEFETASYRLNAMDFYPTQYAKSRTSLYTTKDARNCFWLRDMATSTSAYVRDGLGNMMTSVSTCGYGGTEGMVSSAEAVDDIKPYVYPVIRVNLSDESLWKVGSRVYGN